MNYLFIISLISVILNGSSGCIKGESPVTKNEIATDTIYTYTNPVGGITGTCALTVFILTMGC